MVGKRTDETVRQKEPQPALQSPPRSNQKAGGEKLLGERGWEEEGKSPGGNPNEGGCNEWES